MFVGKDGVKKEWHVRLQAQLQEGEYIAFLKQNIWCLEVDAFANMDLH